MSCKYAPTPLRGDALYQCKYTPTPLQERACSRLAILKTRRQAKGRSVITTLSHRETRSPYHGAILAPQAMPSMLTGPPELCCWPGPSGLCERPLRRQAKEQWCHRGPTASIPSPLQQPMAATCLGTRLPPKLSDRADSPTRPSSHQDSEQRDRCAAAHCHTWGRRMDSSACCLENVVYSRWPT